MVSILDAGSGPGHWTHLLGEHGCDTTGVDITPDFVNSAHARFPDIPFTVGDLLSVPFKNESADGVLAWYSLIHMESRQRTTALQEIRRILTPHGSLLIGGFLGAHEEPFNHAITRAFYWSAEGLSSDLQAEGFTILSRHLRKHDGQRSHLAIVAHKE
ncbi:class I SAM-dependent methyltransferase [Corynebacterium kroppenstedtii]|uniref:class I SAM-dependent methyltransferase n=1 Tax=Corynebacterium sp. PCR 32 TaxID=3351342 RepID=UPI0030A33AA6